MQLHSIDRLRSRCMEQSTVTFRARGSRVKRCPQCLQAEFACLCPWQVRLTSEIEFILIMHRNELYKPTNSGRLLAELFPEQTQVYLWSRTNVDTALLDQLNDKSRQTLLLFPDDTAATLPITTQQTPDKPQQLVILDGTWKQAARMARLSPWLAGIPKVTVNIDQTIRPDLDYPYGRQAIDQHQLSTAAATAAALQGLGDKQSALALYHYINIFNQHCWATRSNIRPEPSASHAFLAARLPGAS